MKNDAWNKMGITEKHLDACDEMIQYAFKDNTIEYWKKCKKFLQDVSQMQYDKMTSKQRNWVVSIKSELIENGFV